MIVNDSHCHFFSRNFFQCLSGERGQGSQKDPVAAVTASLGFEAPGTPHQLAHHWIQELDRNKVNRAALIASLPGDEESVADAVSEYPQRFVGFFMVDPREEGAPDRVKTAFVELGLRCACLFPAMHDYSVYGDSALKVFETAATLEKTAVFVHCGVLSVGVRGKLGLPSQFSLRRSNPLDLHPVALAYPDLPIILPHFGAGFFREALMLSDLCPNVYLDTSSSNSWVKYYPSLTLEDVFRQAIDVLGPDRLLFGTDSSFFPRGWQRVIWDSQSQVLDTIGVTESAQQQIFAGNFERLFPTDPGPSQA